MDQLILISAHACLHNEPTNHASTFDSSSFLFLSSWFFLRSHTVARSWNYRTNNSAQRRRKSEVRLLFWFAWYFVRGAKILSSIWNILFLMLHSTMNVIKSYDKWSEDKMLKDMLIVNNHNCVYWDRNLNNVFSVRHTYFSLPPLDTAHRQRSAALLFFPRQF